MDNKLEAEKIPLDTIEVAGALVGIDRTGLGYSPAISPHPIAGDFRLTSNGKTTRAIPFDASKEEIEAALAEIQNLSRNKQ